jgi:hypothetical protein
MDQGGIMAAPKGNQNARRGKHPRVQVPFSGTQLDAMYTYLGIGEHEGDPDKIRDLAHEAMHDYLRNLPTARCFNGEKCHTGAEEEPTSDMVWCEISGCYGWYCGVCNEVKHLPKSEGKAALAAYQEYKQEAQ